MIETIKLCMSCADTMGEHYKLTEIQNPELKRSRCAHCTFRGYISEYSFDPSRPIREVEGK